MPSPTSSASTSLVPPAYEDTIDALLGGMKWGGGPGAGTDLTFSFPWTTSATAVFAGFGGTSYSVLGEDTAAVHAGLDAVQAAAARSALLQWSTVANVKFTEVADTATDVGDIRFAWTSATRTTSTGSQAWGWAYYPNGRSPSAGDIWISTLASGAAAADWVAGSANFSSLLHEVGHALGLKHPFEDSPTLPAALATEQYSVMAYAPAAHNMFMQAVRAPNGTTTWTAVQVQPETPMLLDIAAMQYMYGANLAHRTGDDLYTFDPARPFFKTLWDAGGNDTISIGNFATGSVIDLRAGQFSSIAIRSGFNWPSAPPASAYDGTDNLAIAFGVVIENAIGGSGSDLLRGNDAANRLDGGAGDDTLYGGAGNDFFDWDAGRRAGADTFHGGAGDDTFALTPGDRVVELANEGTDTVHVSFSHVLADNVERLVASGSVGLVLGGNGLDNFLSGTAGDDLIDGGAGDDTVVYDGAGSGYVLAPTARGYTVLGSGTGRDVLTGVEFVQFSDLRVTLVLDLEAPSALAFHPGDGATGVAVGSSIRVTFSEAIQRGAGAIVLKTAAGVTAGSWDAANSATLRVAGSALTLDPEAELATGTGYRVEFAPGAIQDLAGNAFAGGGFGFTTTVAGRLIAGTVQSETLAGGADADTLRGGEGYDLLNGLAGDDVLDGGVGLDMALYAGSRASYSVARAGDGYTVSGPEGTDTLVDVERLKFADGHVALDVDGTGGQAYRIYQAAFNRTPDAGGLGYWIHVLDGGASLRGVALGFMGSPEFVEAYGASPSHEQLVTRYYENVLHRAPELDGYNYWVGVLNGGLDTAAGVLASISESAENRAGVIAAIADGFGYTAFA